MTLFLNPLESSYLRLGQMKAPGYVSWSAENRSQLVPDVHAFPGHIACDCASRSELVVPLRRNGAVFGVLDLDSPTEGRFTEADRAGMERLCAAIESSL